jgi:hypothetical protein
MADSVLGLKRNEQESSHASLSFSEATNAVFCDVTPCNFVDTNQCFGGQCRFHFQREVETPEMEAEVSPEISRTSTKPQICFQRRYGPRVHSRHL